MWILSLMNFSPNIYLTFHMALMRKADPRTRSYLDMEKEIIIINHHLWKLKDELSLTSNTAYNVINPFKIRKQ